MQIAINLLLNTTFLVSISIIFNLFFQRIQKQKLLYQLLGGVILGLAGIVLMLISLKLPNGVIFDTRSILLSISGLFYGFVPTSIAALIIVAYRAFLGRSQGILGASRTEIGGLLRLVDGCRRALGLYRSVRHEGHSQSGVRRRAGLDLLARRLV